MLKSLTSMTDIDRRERSRESAWTHCLIGHKGLERWLDCWPHWLCCFSMISGEGTEALVAMGWAVAICQHHLYMAFSEAPTGRPRGGELVKYEGPAIGFEPGSKSKIADGSTVGN